MIRLDCLRFGNNKNNGLGKISIEMFSGLGNSLLTREGKYSNTPGYKCNKKDILTQYGTACTQLIDLVTYVEPVISNTVFQSKWPKHGSE